MNNFDRYESSGIDRLLTYQDRKYMFSGKDFKVIKYRGQWYKTDGHHLGEELDEEIKIIERKNELNVLKIGEKHNKKYYIIYDDNTLSEEQKGCLHFCSNEGIEDTCLNGEWCRNTSINQKRQEKPQLSLKIENIDREKDKIKNKILQFTKKD